MNGKAKNKQDANWSEKLGTVLAIVAIILLFGLIIYNYFERKKLKDQVVRQIELSKARLIVIQTRIRELEIQTEKLLRTERMYFFWARLIIGLMLIGMNLYYMEYYSCGKLNPGDQLNLNGAIVLIYSFVAFVLYGTPSALVAAIKNKASKIFLRNHIHVFTELEQLRKEEIELLNFLAKNEGE